MIFQNKNACFKKMLLKLNSLSINKVNIIKIIIIYSKNNILITDLNLILSFFLILIFEEDFSFFFFFDYDFFKILTVLFTSSVFFSRQARQNIILYDTELK